MKDEITGFWVVTTATKDSEINDVLFYSDIKEMRLQFLGGLKAEEVVGIFSSESSATYFAKKEMAKAKRTIPEPTIKRKSVTTFQIPNEIAQRFEELLNDAEYYNYDTCERDFYTDFSLENLTPDQELEIIGLENEAKL